MSFLYERMGMERLMNSFVAAVASEGPELVDYLPWSQLKFQQHVISQNSQGIVAHMIIIMGEQDETMWSAQCYFIFFQTESPHAMQHCALPVGHFGRTISPFLVDAAAVAGTELLDLGVAATGGLALAREEAVGAIK